MKRRRSGALEGRLAVGLQPAHLRRPPAARVHRPAGRCRGHRRRRVNGSVGNCSGGITPWGTALSCEENFDGYGTTWRPTTSAYGWHQFGGKPEDAEYDPEDLQEVRLGLRARPVRPRLRRAASTPRSGASATRTRPSATSPASSSCSTWATTRPTRASTSSSRRASSSRRQRSNNRAHPRGGPALHRALGAGGPAPLRRGGRHRPDQRDRGHRPLGRRCRRTRSTTPRPSCAPPSARRSSTRTSPPTGRRTSRWPRTAASSSRSRTTPRWRARLARLGAPPAREGQRPRGARVPLARLRRGRPDRLGRRRATEGFSSPDNLVFDKAGNLWVVTDISSSRLNQGQRVRVPQEQRAVHRADVGSEQGHRASASPTGRSSARSRGRTSRPTRRRCSSTSSTRAS